jgi:hypothetical protein
MTYTGQEEGTLKKAAAYLGEVALPSGATEIECEAAWALSVRLNEIAEALPILLTTPRSDEEFMAFSIAQQQVAAALTGTTYEVQP